MWQPSDGSRWAAHPSPLSWRWIRLTLYLAVNAGLMLSLWPANVDWELSDSLPNAIATGTLYDTPTEAPWVWSPVAAPVMAVVSWLGWWPWALAHVAVVLLLRTGG